MKGAESVAKNRSISGGMAWQQQRVWQLKRNSNKRNAGALLQLKKANDNRWAYTE